MTNSLTQLDTITDIDHQQMMVGGEQYTREFASRWWHLIRSVQVDDFEQIRQIRLALLSLAKAEQEKFWQQNDALKQPLQQLMDDTHAGEGLNQLLQGLQQKIARMKPPKSNRISLKERFFLLFSWKQTAWQMWLENYHELKVEVIESTDLLDAEKRQLRRDGRMLSKQQVLLAQQIKQLEHGFDLTQTLGEHLTSQLTDNNECEPTWLKMIDDELVSAVQQRSIDLQQQLLIARQAVMTIELIIKQNEQQAHGIDQALQTTAATLDVTAALVLAKQGKQGAVQQQSGQAAVINQQLKTVQESIARTLDEVEGLKAKSINPRQPKAFTSD